MTRDQAISMILRRVIRRSADTDLVADIVAEWNLAESVTFERGYPKYWFMLEVAAIEVDATGFRAPLPADFIELYEEAPAVLMVNSNGTLTALEGTDRAMLEWSLDGPGSNAAYSIMEGYLLLSSQLAEDTVLRILYYKSEPRNEVAYQGPAQPDPNRWLQYAPDLLIGWVGRIIAGLMDRDKEALAQFDTQYGLAAKRLMVENSSRKEAGRVRFLNGGSYPVAGAARTLTQAG